MAGIDFASLGSGSSGNATVVRAGSTTILLDCGFSRKRLQERLNLRGLDLHHLDAILVTHEHSDHCSGVPVVARNHDVPVYTSNGTAARLLERDSNHPDLQFLLREIKPNRPFRISDLGVYPIGVPHDASEPLQFVFRYQSVSLGVLTDCGSITNEIVRHYKGLDGILLETNHDLEMLHNGPYPPHLKDRVGGNYGHLNNRQSREFADQVVAQNTQHLVLGHISQKNNTLEVIRDEFSQLQSDVPITYASQAEGTGWLSVSA